MNQELLLIIGQIVDSKLNEKLCYEMYIQSLDASKCGEVSCKNCLLSGKTTKSVRLAPRIRNTIEVLYEQ